MIIQPPENAGAWPEESKGRGWRGGKLLRSDAEAGRPAVGA